MQKAHVIVVQKLLNEVAVNQIEAIDCELSIYRKGCVSIHVDIKKNYVTWRESKQWCNNFTKTIPSKAVDELISFISTSSLLNDILETRSFADEHPCSFCESKLTTDPTSDDSKTVGEARVETDHEACEVMQPSETEQNSDCLIPGKNGTSQHKHQYDDIDWYQHVDQSKSSWQIVMVFDNCNFTRHGRFPLPKGWIDFQRIIEKVSRAPFRLF